MEPDKRDGQIDVLRGFAIIGVIFIHSSFEHRFDQPTLLFCSFLSSFFDWAVLAFFFLSGLLLDEKQPVWGFLKKRFMSLLVPFWFYNLFYNLAFGVGRAITGRQFGGHPWNPTLWWLAGFHSPAFQLYFLPYLFFSAVGLFCLCRMIDVRRHGWVFIAGFALMVAFYQHVGWPDRSHGPEWTKLPLYAMAYLLGIAGRPVQWEKPRLPLVVSLLLLAVGTWFFRQPCLQSLAVLPILYLAVNAVHSLSKSKLFQKIGRCSGVIYYWHTPIMLPVFTIILALCHVPPLANLLASVIMTVAVCIFFRQALEAAFKRFLKTKLPASIVP